MAALRNSGKCRRQTTCHSFLFDHFRIAPPCPGYSAARSARPGQGPSSCREPTLRGRNGRSCPGRRPVSTFLLTSTGLLMEDPSRQGGAVDLKWTSQRSGPDEEMLAREWGGGSLACASAAFRRAGRRLLFQSALLPEALRPWVVDLPGRPQV